MEGDEQGRRRRRRGPKRRRVVQFSLDDGEYAELEEAAARDGLSRGAYAANAALAAARGQTGPQVAALREALRELMRASEQVRKIGVNLNQTVAALHSTGEEPPTLRLYAAACMRFVTRLDEAAHAVLKKIP
ncbi:hypothetical protein AB0B54_30630 [Microbispora bryophytorum]|uniref:plasmid mobilization protein n=1 Tax=Microbispora bryophytorum TaxID=1460882 RepID=UPI003401622D